MNLVLVVAGLMLVALPGLTTGLGARLAPPEWAWLTATSLRIGLGAIRLGLLVTATPTMLRLAGIHDLAETCHHALGSITPGGTFSGLASGALLLLLQTRMVRSRQQARRARRTLHVEPWLGQHHPGGDHDLVVLPTSAAIAFALKGRPPQVVVSEGLTRALSDDELAAVIRHEQCHLDNRHHRYLELALAAEAGLGWLQSIRRSSATLRLALERWADEAAAHTSSRADVRGALTKVADSMLTPAPAFTAAETIGARLEALDADPTEAPARWRLAASAPAAVLAATVFTAALTGSAPIHHGILEPLGYCPL